MLDFSDFKNGDIKTKKFLSRQLRKLFDLASLELTIINEDHFQLPECDELIAEIFPSSEAEEYKPSNLVSDDNTFCLAVNHNGVVIACATVSFDDADQTAILHSIAVDDRYREQKIGSLLMLCINEIANKFDITSISLISSGYGKPLYISFGFREKGSQSFDAVIPFEENIVDEKIEAIHACFKQQKKNKRKISPIKDSEAPEILETDTKRSKTNPTGMEHHGLFSTKRSILDEDGNIIANYSTHTPTVSSTIP